MHCEWVLDKLTATPSGRWALEAKDQIAVSQTVEFVEQKVMQTIENNEFMSYITPDGIALIRDICMKMKADLPSLKRLRLGREDMSFHSNRGMSGLTTHWKGERRQSPDGTTTYLVRRTQYTSTSRITRRRG